MKPMDFFETLFLRNIPFDLIKLYFRDIEYPDDVICGSIDPYLFEYSFSFTTPIHRLTRAFPEGPGQHFHKVEKISVSRRIVGILRIKVSLLQDCGLSW